MPFSQMGPADIQTEGAVEDLEFEEAWRDLDLEDDEVIERVFDDFEHTRLRGQRRHPGDLMTVRPPLGLVAVHGRGR